MQKHKEIMKKILEITGIAACLLVGGFLIWKSTEKETNDLDEEDEEPETSNENNDTETKEEISQQDSTEEAEEEEEKPNENNNLVRTIYSDLRFNSSFDLDLIDLDKIIGEDAPLGIIHVNMTEHGGLDYLTFFMELPVDVVKKSDMRGVTIMFRNAVDVIDNKMFPFLPKDVNGESMIRGKLAGKFIVVRDTVDKKGRPDKVYEMYPIMKEFYDDPDLGYVEFDRNGNKINGLYNYITKKRVEIDKLEKKGKDEDGVYLQDIKNPGVLVKVKDLLFGFQIEIPVVCDEIPSGIDISGAIKVLEYLTGCSLDMKYQEAVKVRIKNVTEENGRKRTRNSSFGYDGILFQNPCTRRDEVYSAEPVECVEDGKKVTKFLPEITSITWG
jgi:hypothetical protein